MAPIGSRWQAALGCGGLGPELSPCLTKGPLKLRSNHQARPHQLCRLHKSADSMKGWTLTDSKYRSSSCRNKMKVIQKSKAAIFTLFTSLSLCFHSSCSFPPFLLLLLFYAGLSPSRSFLFVPIPLLSYTVDTSFPCFKDQIRSSHLPFAKILQGGPSRTA